MHATWTKGYKCPSGGWDRPPPVIAPAAAVPNKDQALWMTFSGVTRTVMRCSPG